MSDGRVALSMYAEINPETTSSYESSRRFRYIDLSSVNRGVIDYSSLQEHSLGSAPSRARRPVRHGDFIFGNVRPQLRSHARIEMGSTHVASTGFTVVRARNGQADSRFLGHFLLSDEAARQAAARETGSSYPAVTEKDVADFLLPKLELEEQRRIAEILDTIDETIQATERVIAKLQAKQAGIVDSFLNSPSENWSSGTLFDACILQRGFDITKAQQRSGPYPVVSSGGIASFHDEWKVKGPGVVTGRKGALGKVYFVNGNFWPHDTSLYVKDFRGNDPEFVALLLRSLRLDRFDAASAVPTLNRNFVHPLPVKVPPLSEQRRLITLYTSANHRVGLETEGLAKHRKLRAGLATDLLSGRVRTVAS
jgi:type I restriction enzyme, S subunit